MQVNPSVNLHLHHSNKQQLILTKLYANSAPFVGNQTAKFRLNPLKQTIATATFARSPQNN